ncbi:hypothetical protein ES703_85072 [subsurface metagenome]
MTNLDKDKQYDQLNQRSRWYTKQIWHVPFAFIAIISLGIGKIDDIPERLKTVALLILSLFSLAAFVNVTALKYYERRAVRGMQQLEDPVVSGGGSVWYMSFVLYIKIMLVIAAIGFLWVATENLVCWLRFVLLICYASVVVKMWIFDWKRSKLFLKDIRANMKSHSIGVNNANSSELEH